MLPKERVAAVFAHEPSDRVPLYMGSWSSRIASHLLGRDAHVGGTIQQYRESVALWHGPEAHAEFISRSCRDAIDIALAANLDYVRSSYWRLPERPSQRLNEYTFRYGDETQWRVMRFDPATELYQVIDRSPGRALTLADIRHAAEQLEQDPPVPSQADYPELQAAIAELGHERAVAGHAPLTMLPHELSWLEAMALDPSLMRRYGLAQVRAELPLIPLMVQMGTPYLQGGGDFASQHGPFYSPAAFREVMLPAIRLIAEECHRHGCYYMFASDGDLWPVADDLFGASGVDAFYEVDIRCNMSLRRLRSQCPHLTLLGGIASETLHLGSVDDVRREVMDALEVAHELGSIIVGCSNLVVPHTPLANLEMMLTTLAENR